MTTLKPTRCVRHHGICAASAVVPLGKTWFLAASEEDGRLRVYDRDRTGPPLFTQPVAAWLDPHTEQRTALATGAWLGNQLFWISSHERKENHQLRLSSTRVSLACGTMRMKAAGKPFPQKCGSFLDGASLPKALREPAVTGLGARNGKLLIVLRAGDGHETVAVTLKNPRAVVRGREPPHFGTPFPLPLDQGAVLSMTWWPTEHTFLLLARGCQRAEPDELFHWSGRRRDAVRPLGSLPANVRADLLLTFPSDRELFLVCGAGNENDVDEDEDEDEQAVPCLARPSAQRFFSSSVVSPPRSP